MISTSGSCGLVLPGACATCDPQHLKQQHPFPRIREKVDRVVAQRQVVQVAQLTEILGQCGGGQPVRAAMARAGTDTGTLT